MPWNRKTTRRDRKRRARKWNARYRQFARMCEMLLRADGFRVRVTSKCRWGSPRYSSVDTPPPAVP